MNDSNQNILSYFKKETEILELYDKIKGCYLINYITEDNFTNKKDFNVNVNVNSDIKKKGKIELKNNKFDPEKAYALDRKIIKNFYGFNFIKEDFLFFPKKNQIIMKNFYNNYSLDFVNNKLLTIKFIIDYPKKKKSIKKSIFYYFYDIIGSSKEIYEKNNNKISFLKNELISIYNDKLVSAVNNYTKLVHELINRHFLEYKEKKEKILVLFYTIKKYTNYINKKITNNFKYILKESDIDENIVNINKLFDKENIFEESQNIYNKKTYNNNNYKHDIFSFFRIFIQINKFIFFLFYIVIEKYINIFNLLLKKNIKVDNTILSNLSNLPLYDKIINQKDNLDFNITSKLFNEFYLNNSRINDTYRLNIIDNLLDNEYKLIKLDKNIINLFIFNDTYFNYMSNDFDLIYLPPQYNYSENDNTIIEKLSDKINDKEFDIYGNNIIVEMTNTTTQESTIPEINNKFNTIKIPNNPNPNQKILLEKIKFIQYLKDNDKLKNFQNKKSFTSNSVSFYDGIKKELNLQIILPNVLREIIRDINKNNIENILNKYKNEFIKTIEKPNKIVKKQNTVVKKQNTESKKNEINYLKIKKILDNDITTKKNLKDIYKNIRGSIDEFNININDFIKNNTEYYILHILKLTYHFILYLILFHNNSDSTIKNIFDLQNVTLDDKIKTIKLLLKILFKLFDYIIKYFVITYNFGLNLLYNNKLYGNKNNNKRNKFYEYIYNIFNVILTNENLYYLIYLYYENYENKNKIYLLNIITLLDNNLLVLYLSHRKFNNLNFMIDLKEYTLYEYFIFSFNIHEVNNGNKIYIEKYKYILNYLKKNIIKKKIVMQNAKSKIRNSNNIFGLSTILLNNKVNVKHNLIIRNIGISSNETLELKYKDLVKNKSELFITIGLTNINKDYIEGYLTEQIKLMGTEKKFF